MAAQPKPITQAESYLQLERASLTRHEFINGQIVAMAGASRRHNIIVSNTHISLGTQLIPRDCEIYQGDMRVKISKTQAYTYPDVVVVCGEVRLEDTHLDTLLNPTVIVEVLSPSTEALDRGIKLIQYQAIESLQEYVLIAQDTPLIQHYVREAEGGWHFTTLTDLDATLTLPSIACVLPLADVYRKIEFDSPVPPKF